MIDDSGDHVVPGVDEEDPVRQRIQSGVAAEDTRRERVRQHRGPHPVDEQRGLSRAVGVVHGDRRVRDSRTGTGLEVLRSPLPREGCHGLILRPRRAPAPDYLLDGRDGRGRNVRSVEEVAG